MESIIPLCKQSRFLLYHNSNFFFPKLRSLLSVYIQSVVDTRKICNSSPEHYLRKPSVSSVRYSLKAVTFLFPSVWISIAGAWMCQVLNEKRCKIYVRIQFSLFYSRCENSWCVGVKILMCGCKNISKNLR